jgi:hypothetical protein
MYFHKKPPDGNRGEQLKTLAGSWWLHRNGIRKALLTIWFAMQNFPDTQSGFFPSRKVLMVLICDLLFSSVLTSYWL